MTALRVISLFLGVACIVLFIPPLIMYRILNIGNATGLLVGVVLIIYGLLAVVVNRGISSLWNILPGKVLVCVAGCMLVAALVMAGALAACGTTATSGAEANKEATTAVTEAVAEDVKEIFTERDLEQTADLSEAEKITLASGRHDRKEFGRTMHICEECG